MGGCSNGKAEWGVEVPNDWASWPADALSSSPHPPPLARRRRKQKSAGECRSQPEVPLPCSAFTCSPPKAAFSGLIFLTQKW